MVLIDFLNKTIPGGGEFFALCAKFCPPLTQILCTRLKDQGLMGTIKSLENTKTVLVFWQNGLERKEFFTFQPESELNEFEPHLKSAKTVIN